MEAAWGVAGADIVRLKLQQIMASPSVHELDLLRCEPSVVDGVFELHLGGHIVMVLSDGAAHRDPTGSGEAVIVVEEIRVSEGGRG